MKEVKMPVDTLNAVLAYLGNRPYQEVFNIVKLIQDTTKAVEDEVKDDGKMDSEGD